MVTANLDQLSGRRANVLRQVRLRPASAHLYPDLPPNQWLSAAEVAARLLGGATKRGAAPLARDRILPEEHFDFQGGGREAALRYRARTRWSDHPSTRAR